MEMNLFSVVEEETMEMNLFLLLPMEIAEDLFSRVPFDSILQCKLVCKSLRALVNQLSFVQEHHQSNLHQKGYLFRITSIIEPGFHYGEYKEEVTRFNLTTKPVISRSITSHRHHPFADAAQWCIVGSCKGLICLRSILHHEPGIGHDDMYVCNPYTGKYRKLPKGKGPYHQRPDQPHDVHVAYGFGYHRITGEYKVIRIYYYNIRLGHQRKLSSSTYVEVHTLGSSTGWRRIEEIKHKLYREESKDPDGKESQNNSYGVLVKGTGALYWITKKNHIISFDLAEEKFQLIAMPPVKIVCPSVLAVLGGCLCVTIDDDDRTHIWVLSKKDCSCPLIEKKKDYCPWIEKNKKKCSCPWIENNKKNCSCRWIEKFSIPWGGGMYNYNYPLAKLENGKILLHRNFKIVLYDPKTESLVEIEQLIRFDVIPYAKSSVSLEARSRKKEEDHLWRKRCSSCSSKKQNGKKMA